MLNKQSRFNRIGPFTDANAFRALFLCSSLTVLSTSFVHAQSTDDAITEFTKTLPQDITARLIQRPEQYLQSLSQLIYQISPDGVATREAAQLQADIQSAASRAREITQLLRFDLDGDGDVSAAEIDTQKPYLTMQERGQLALWVFENDTNSDETLSLQEILAAARATVDEQTQRTRNPNIDTIMAFDFNADGRVDLAEVAAVIAAFDPTDIDTLGNRRTAQVSPPASCTAPKPQSGTEVVFLSGNEGGAISTLAVSGQHVETSVGTVTITEGTEPLYIFATAYDSIVWKFDGAVDRVQQLVVQPRETTEGPGAAVVGIENDKVTFVSPASCIEKSMYQLRPETEALLAPLSLYLERKFDHIVLANTIRNFQVPPAPELLTSAEQNVSPYKTPVQFSIGDRDYEISSAGLTIVGSDLNSSQISAVSKGLILSLMRSYPGGIIETLSEDAHAPASIEPYTVLPQQAGLLQLVAEGSLNLIEGRGFLIKAPIAHFPAGLNGGHSVGFVLGTGIPMPDGTPGHSQVISEETGECLSGRRCRP